MNFNYIRLLVVVLCFNLASCASHMASNRYEGYKYAGSKTLTRNAQHGGGQTFFSTKIEVFYKENNNYIEEIIVDVSDRIGANWYWHCPGALEAPRDIAIYINAGKDEESIIISDILNKTGYLHADIYKGTHKFVSCSDSTRKYTNHLFSVGKNIKIEKKRPAGTRY